MNNTQKAQAAYIAPKISHYFGTVKKDKDRIALYAPTFDCGWYWGFGYLGNKNCHYHLKSYHLDRGFGEYRDISMFDAFKKDYILCDALQNDSTLWTFCELVQTAYSLLAVAEIFSRGGSHQCKNPCQELLKNPDMYEHINFVLLPALFKEIDKLFVPLSLSNPNE